MVLIASCVINLCIGVLYTWSVFAGPMAEYIAQTTGITLTAADLSIVFSVGNSTGFITMIGGGFLNQKIGPRWVIFTGGVLFGLGFVICGLSNSIGMLVVGYGLFSGLATASYGISSVILPHAGEKKHQIEHQKGLSLLRHGLKEIYNLAINENDLLHIIAYGEHGKPFLHGFDGIHFNISHCDGLAACAFSDKPLSLFYRQRTGIQLTAKYYPDFLL